MVEPQMTQMNAEMNKGEKLSCGARDLSRRNVLNGEAHPQTPSRECRSTLLRNKFRVPARRIAGFTLIELLVVIAIIGILAAMVLGLLPLAARARVNNRVKAEMAQVQTAIESYKEKRGFFPPDNVKNPGSNSLYYELSGTVFDATMRTYTTLSGEGPLPAASVNTAFNAGGFVNSNATADDAKNFHPTIKMGQQVKEMDVNGVKVKLLGVSVNGPSGTFCTWVYNSSAPTHNPNGYDLWVDATVNGKTKRFGNWKDD